MDKLTQIKEVITALISAGDNNDEGMLLKVLHPQYQNIQDGFFDKNGIHVFSMQEYAELVATRRFGGSRRSIEFVSIEELGSIAIAKVKLESERLHFISFITAVFEKGVWLVINNTPSIELKAG